MGRQNWPLNLELNHSGLYVIKIILLMNKSILILLSIIIRRTIIFGKCYLHQCIILYLFLLWTDVLSHPGLQLFLMCQCTKYKQQISHTVWKRGFCFVFSLLYCRMSFISIALCHKVFTKEFVVFSCLYKSTARTIIAILKYQKFALEKKPYCQSTDQGQKRW